jgi:hypothetical protein
VTIYRDVLRAFTSRHQPIEDLLWDMATLRSVADAVGVQLDGLGDVLDESRGALPDGAYRAILRAKVLAIRSRGLWADVLAVLGAGAPESDHTRAASHFPSSGQIDSAAVDWPRQVWRVLRGSWPAGSRLVWSFSTAPVASTFAASGIYPGEEYDPDRGAGAGAYDPAVGGASAGAFSNGG